MANYFGATGVSDGGLGEMLRQQLSDETDETRRRRLLEQRQQGLLGPGAQLQGTGGLSAMFAGMGR